MPVEAQIEHIPEFLEGEKGQVMAKVASMDLARHAS
jgi:hypothetical protein